jgi:hypothetical protein
LGLKLNLCRCGSGKETKICHPGLGETELRRILKIMLTIDNDTGELTINQSLRAVASKPTVVEAILRMAMVNTPAGRIIYPLLVTNGKYALRPITIDGLFIIAEDIAITCMLSPIHFCHIKFNINNVSRCPKKRGEYTVKCKIETFGTPFQSIFALEADYDNVYLYHHTNDKAAAAISKSMYMNSSAWNIQGTRKLEDKHYIYLTNIPKIENNLDLIDIAMCDVGSEIAILSDLGKKRIIKVYRDNPINRPVALKIKVPNYIIAPNSLILHNNKAYLETSTLGSYSWWEVFMPNIFRISVKPRTGLPLKKTEDGFRIIVDDNLLLQEGFRSALGNDIIGLMSIWSEKPIHRIMPRPSDRGELDSEWVNVWKNNLSNVSASTFLDIISKI